MPKKIITIIGGGAAGMMAAATILEGIEGLSDEGKPVVYLFEKNSRLGAKVLISGGGRCNVTTGTFKRKDLLKQYTRGAEFLDYAFRQFGPKKVRRWFEDHGVALKEEEDGRIFPVSDDGSEVVGVFEDLFSQYTDQITVCFKESVQAIEKKMYEDGGAYGGYKITTDKHTYECDIVVMATGGSAYQKTGSTGDGYAFARSVGHTITQLGPSLNSFVTAEGWIHDCSGISFEDARIHIAATPLQKESGPVLLTHFGVTGPHVFVVASQCAFSEVSAEQPLAVYLQPIAQRGYEQRNAFLLEQTSLSPNKQLLGILAYKLPKRFVQSWLVEYGCSKTMTLAQLPKEQRKRLAHLLGGGIPLSLIKRRPGDEFVTAGGVATDQINPKTMQSRCAPGVYIVGELLNVDGVTGGYNLQACRATGNIAGKNIVTSIIDK